MKKKILLIGWDGADWEHINPLLDAGELPTLNQFVNEGVMGNLATLQPVLSPMLWNSVATGKFADKHGIYGFTEPDHKNGGARPYSSLSRGTKALWNILSQNGIKSNVINWWASHPAEKIDGCVVTNLFNGVKMSPDGKWEITPGTIHPASIQQKFARFKFFPTELTQEHILPFIPRAAEVDQEKDKRLVGFAKTFAEMVTTHSIATAVMETQPWDFMAIYYTGIDHFSHGFMHFHPPRMPNVPEKDFEIYKDVIVGAYRFHDMMLERLLQMAGEDTTVIICSDHGFQSGAFRPAGTPREPAGPAVWHRQYGILAVKGPGIKKDERIYGASLIDIGPTILQLLDLPVGEDMDGRPLVEIFESTPEIKRIESWDDVDGNHGMHDSDADMGLSDSEELMKQFVALGYIDEQGDDKEKMFESAEIESKYNLARNLMWQDRNDEALPLLKEISTAAPWECRFIIQLANCYLAAGYATQAIRVVETAFDLKKTHSLQAIIIYAKAVLQLGKEEMGLQLLELVGKRASTSPGIFVQMGQLFANQRKWDSAKKAYLKAIELHVEHARAWQGLATAYLRTGQNQNAAEAALNAVGLIYRLPNAHLTLGIALARSGEYEKAVMAFETAIRFAPRMRKAHRWLSIVHQQLGNRQVALDYRNRSFVLAEAMKVEKTQCNDRLAIEFPVQDYEQEATRIERLKKERPSPSDPVKKSGKSFVLVSGLPRSGTSLMMQLLQEGGVELVSDGIREADSDNPQGYLEWEPIKKIAEQPELLDDDELNGKAIKVITMLLDKLPNVHDYKVVFMMRPINEIAQSQQKMINRLDTDGANLDDHDLVRGLRDHRSRTLEWLRNARHMEFIQVSYPALVHSPEGELQKIREFLGEEILPAPEKMGGVINESLHRNRTRQVQQENPEE